MDEPFLIGEAQKGDLEAFNRLVLAYQARAYNLAYRIMGEAEAAADVTQEAFLSAFRGLRFFRGGSFRSWLLRIVTNACYDELRRWKRRPSTSLDLLVDEGLEPDAEASGTLASSQEGPEDAAERAELARAVEDCLNRLSTEFRVVAVLADVQGYPYDEVATIVGKPVGTIKSRLARARARLRDCLQGHRELLPGIYRLKDGPEQ